MLNVCAVLATLDLIPVVWTSMNVLEILAQSVLFVKTNLEVSLVNVLVEHRVILSDLVALNQTNPSAARQQNHAREENNVSPMNSLVKMFVFVYKVLPETT